MEVESHLVMHAALRGQVQRFGAMSHSTIPVMFLGQDDKSIPSEPAGLARNCPLGGRSPTIDRLKILRIVLVAIWETVYDA